MKQKILILLGIAVLCVPKGFSQDPFHQYFIEKTMRLDYLHCGTSDKEWFAYDEILRENTWAGCYDKLVDTLDLGKYRFEVTDNASGAVIYSRGFSSVFGEWQTTTEAADGVQRAFHESVRFPWPKDTVTVVLETRDTFNQFQKLWSHTIDPSNPNMRKNSCPDYPVVPFINNGPSPEKVDIVILPDGYTKDEMGKFNSDVKRLLAVLFDTSPFKERQSEFNVWGVEAPSMESGIDNPQAGIYRNTVLSSSFNAFGSDRYVLTWDNKAVRKVAAAAPYDFLYILFNSEKYGGGGIYNLYSTCTSDNVWSDYIFTHEFGHSFAGLGDEYYTSDVAYSDFYPVGIEPWEPNITTFANGKTPKWVSCLGLDMPIPTPWEKAKFDAHQSEYGKERATWKENGMNQTQIDSLVHINDQWVSNFLRTQAHWGQVGAFEGAGYASQGIYRPYLDCRMFTRSMTGFCPVCRRAIDTMIDFYTYSKIDDRKD